MCNTWESSIQDTTPVGQFSPQGDSPCGCVDMAGNVWERTSSEYEGEKGLRVLRGGSWNNNQNNAQCAYRNRNNENNSNNNRGFRLVSHIFLSVFFENVSRKCYGSCGKAETTRAEAMRLGVKSWRGLSQAGGYKSTGRI